MSLATVHRLPLRLLATATLGAVLLLATGLAGAWPPLVAVAGAAAVSVVLPTSALVGRGLAIHQAARSSPQLRGECQCPGILGLGTFISGLTAVVLPLVDPPVRPALATAGLAVAAAVYLTGLLRLRGTGTLAGRLRLGLDGPIIGFSVALVGWLLAPGLGVGRPTGYLAAAVAAGSAAIIAAAVLRAPLVRPGAARCGGGAVLAIAGLAMLVVTVGQDAPRWGLLAAGGLVVAAPPLIWAGARRASPAPGPAMIHGTGLHPDLADAPADATTAYDGAPGGAVPPLGSALPVGAVALAMFHHLLTADQPDRTALLLGTTIGALLAVREVPAAAQLRRSARWLAAQQWRLQALVAGTGDVTMVLGDDLRVRWQSPAAGRQLGLPADAAVGHRFTELLNPDEVAAVTDRLRVVLDDRAEDPPEPVLLETRVTDGPAVGATSRRPSATCAATRRWGRWSYSCAMSGGGAPWNARCTG